MTQPPQPGFQPSGPQHPQQPWGAQPHPAPQYQQAPPPQWQQPGPTPQGQFPQGLFPPSPLGTGSFLHIHTGFFPLAFILYLTGPLIMIDGIEVGRNWGDQIVELGPGVHTVHIHTRYLWAIGNADVQIQIAPGQRITASYETPFWAFSAGKIQFH